MGEVLFEARGLHKSFGAIKATDGLDLTLRTGEVHALIGPNGAGKTTALAQLSGELAPDAGRVLFEGRDVTRLSMPKRGRLGIARSFQITSVFDDFTARENVALAVQAKARRRLSLWRDARRDRDLLLPAEEHLRRVGLRDLADLPAASLAHGQRRQLELAMALATRPRVLLLDEPTAGMAAGETEAMAALIGSLKADSLAILLVEHDMDVVFSLAERVSVLVYGRVIASGTPAEVRADPLVRGAYLSEVG
ncbi:MAG TPA: ABC transporter ATP-binding protein [Geminicoccaceae bacterium]|nr:ABC transporter ATP-binding protein [Geminicoccaceae bacterium]